jgi:hypothetical protein
MSICTKKPMFICTDLVGLMLCSTFRKVYKVEDIINRTKSGHMSICTKQPMYICTDLVGLMLCSTFRKVYKVEDIINRTF